VIILLATLPDTYWNVRTTQPTPCCSGHKPGPTYQLRHATSLPRRRAGMASDRLRSIIDLRKPYAHAPATVCECQWLARTPEDGAGIPGRNALSSAPGEGLPISQSAYQNATVQSAWTYRSGNGDWEFIPLSRASRGAEALG